MNPYANLPLLFTKSDLATRWNVTRQVVNNWSSRHVNFPPEIMRVDNDRLPLFVETDVIKYEKERNLKRGDSNGD